MVPFKEYIPALLGIGGVIGVMNYEVDTGAVWQMTK